MKIESDKAVADIKLKVTLNAILARQIGEYVASMFSKDAIITPVDELLPDLFAEEKKENEEAKRKADLELYKAKMMDYADRHNSRRKKGEVK
ncbi:hypothetical protein [Clostridium culturomicium]|uniref:hypothetical protein n=1 Tax=Clostridium culturomicium TaxID=1499683 RepID=UPI003857960F